MNNPIPSYGARKLRPLARSAALLCGLLSLSLPAPRAQADGDPALSPYYTSQSFHGLQDPNGPGFLGGGDSYSSNFAPGLANFFNAQDQENGSTMISTAWTVPTGIVGGRCYATMNLSNASSQSGYYVVGGTGSRTRVQFFTPEAAAQRSVFRWHLSGTNNDPPLWATGRLDFLGGQYNNQNFFYLFQSGNGALFVYGPGDYTYNLNTPLNVPIDLFFWTSAFAQVNRGAATQGSNFTITADYGNTFTLEQIELYDGDDKLIPEWQMADAATNQIVFNQNGPVPPCTTPPPDMIMWLPGDRSGIDLSGHGNSGYPMNGAGFATGLVGSAFSFDGVDDQVVVPHDPSQNTGSQLTIDAWVYPTALSHGRTIVQKRSAANIGGYVFETAASPFAPNDSLQFVLMIGGTYYALGTGSVLQLNAWQHIAATYDGKDMRIFVNGAEVASQPQTGAIDATTDPVVIGRNVVNNTNWQGLLDEIEVFNRALSAGEIEAIYEAGTGGKCRAGCIPAPAAMVGWYAGDGDASDLIGGDPGTLEGGATFSGGMVAQAFSFDGVDDFVSVPDAPALNFGTAEFSIDAWVYFNDTSGEQVLIEKFIETLNSSSTGFSLTKLVDNRLRLGFSGGAFVQSEPLPLAQGTWYHVAATRSSTGAVAVYLNGNLVATGMNGASVSSTATLKLGHRGSPADTPGSADTRGFYLNGRIDEVELFRRALSPEEVLAIATAANAGKCKDIPSADLVVNTTEDNDDGVCGTTHCTLREAINAANKQGGKGTPTISFDIPGAGVHRIALNTRLPVISRPMTIDGYTQPGSSPNTLYYSNNAVILVEVDGTALVDQPDGFEIRGGFHIQSKGSGSVIRGLAIGGFDRQFLDSAVFLDGAGSNAIEGCFIGTDASGSKAIPNFNGLSLLGASNNRIGGTDPAQRNVISGNSHFGMDLFGGADANSIVGNYIGLNAAGTVALGNADGGVHINSCSNNAIGASVDPGRLGLSPAQLADSRPVFLRAGPMLLQISKQTARTTLRQTLMAAGVPTGAEPPALFNVISGNGSAGVRVAGTSSDNRVVGNFIGVDGDEDFTGFYGIPNEGDGIVVAESAQNTRIGDPFNGNFIAYNGGDGVHIVGPQDSRSGRLAPAGIIYPLGQEIVGNTIVGNYGLGINLGWDGVTPNDEQDPDEGPNHLQNYPLLKSAVSDGSATHVTGSFNSTPKRSFRIDFYFGNVCNPSGYGDGLNSFGSAFVTTDENGDAPIDFESFPIGADNYITATATDLDTDPGNTSEFSACVPVTKKGCPEITLSPAKLSDGTVDAAYDETVTASGGNGSYTYTVSDGDLPPGLKLDSGTGQISGTPTTAVGSPFKFEITATDENKCTGSGSYSIAISAVNPVLSSATSRMTHGAAGTFDVNLPLSGLRGVECRRGAGGGARDYTIVLHFDRAVNGGTAGLTGTGMVGDVSFSGSDMIISLTGVTDAQTVTVTASGISTAGGGMLSSASVPVGFLIGDANGDGTVNGGDTVVVRGNSGDAVSGGNYRTDLNADGFIDTGDAVLARAASGNGL